MNESYDSRKPFGGREVYNKSRQELLEESYIVTDYIDEILESPHDSGGEYSGRLHNNSDGMVHERFFKYFEGAEVGGWSWPLTEKAVDIYYSKMKGQEEAEFYRVTFATHVRRPGVSQEPILNTYEIYHGEGGSMGSFMRVCEPDIIGESDWNYTTRDATSYDLVSLFEQLGELRDMLNAQERENSHLAQ